jgi:pyruvate/2-oxoglutarate/acetoin dehydrogenase E1 component
VYSVAHAAVEDVPEGDYEIPLGKARLVQPGSDITLVGWGQQVKVLELAVSRADGPGCPNMGSDDIWLDSNVLVG